MDIREEVHKLLKQNRRDTNGYTYTVPSPDAYPYQWLWDSCFHAIVLSKFEPEVAKNELRSLISKQFDNGMLPHMIYWKPGDLHKYEWGKDGTSAITEPPVIVYAVWKIYEETGDIDFLREMFVPLKRYCRYFIDERDPRQHHLIGIINPDESGEDNSPRFDKALGAPFDIKLDDHLKLRLKLIENNKTCDFNAEDCMKDFFWVKDVPFNSIFFDALSKMENIARIIGHTEDEIYLKTHKELLANAMRDLLFEDGIFWSTDGNSYEKIKIDTWAHFMPLFAGLYTDVEARNLVQNYLLDANTFLSPHGIRTVSRQEESYNPTGFWRGPIWMAPNWFIYKGLKRYGFEQEANLIKEKTKNLILNEGFREYYDPETGKGLGAENFTWGTLVLDME